MPQKKEDYDIVGRFQEVARRAEEKKKKKQIDSSPSQPVLEKMTRTAKGGKDVNLSYEGSETQRLDKADAAKNREFLKRTR